MKSPRVLTALLLAHAVLGEPPLNPNSLGSGASTAHAQTIRTVAFTGDPTPGVNGGTFTSLGAPILNDAGDLAFGGRTANGAGIWVFGDNDNAQRLVVRSGDAPSGAAGAKIDRTFYMSMNAAGRVSFASTLTGIGVTSANDEAVWTDADGALRLVARLGDAAPGTSVKFRRFFFPQLNDAGQVAFPAGITPGASADSGNWINRNGALELLVTPGIPAAGFAAGEKIAGTAGHVLSNTGAAAFTAFTDAYSGVPNFPDVQGLWIDSHGSHSLVARYGTPAPGLPDDFLFSHFGELAFRDNRLAFSASATNDGSYFGGVDGLWVADGGPPELIIRAGQQFPSPAGNIAFSSFGDLQANRAGDFAFTGQSFSDATLPASGKAILSHVDGELEIVTSDSDHPPGTAPGTRFSTTYGYSFAFNDAGQVAFISELVGGDVVVPPRGQPATIVNNVAIWGQDRSGVLRLVVRAGDLLDVDDGDAVDLRRIRSLGFQTGGGSDGRGREGFNAAGQLAFAATFDDGTSGVFVSNLLAVPEPASIIPLLYGIAMIQSVRGTRR
jgi:hypothetical protein